MGFAEIHAQWRRLAYASDIDRQRHEQALKGGFTYNAKGSSPTQGYMVSLHPSQGGDEKVYHVNDLRPEHIAQHRAAISTDPSVYQGAWRDGDHVYLDRSKNVSDLDEAIKLGRANHQKAIWDVKAGKEIRLDTPGS